MESTNYAAERALLGALMQKPHLLRDIDVVATDFYSVQHEALFDLITREVESGRPVDPVSLDSRMNIPGFYAVQLFEVFSAAPFNEAVVLSHAEMVAGLSRKRRLVSALMSGLEEAQGTAWDELDRPRETVRRALESLGTSKTSEALSHISQIATAALEGFSQPKERRFMPTGWEEVDDYLNGGWKPQQVTVLGARPAIGKSAIASCATVAAHHYGVAFFSLEMSETELFGRMAAIEKGIPLSTMTREEFSERDWGRLRDFRKESSGWKVWLQAKPRRTVAQIRKSLADLNQHVPLVIIDYLQLIAPADPKESRERQVSRIAEDLKALAKDFDCHVLALAQVNRAGGENSGNPPNMGHLRESGGIEANADNIILLHRDAQTSDPNEASKIDFIFAKNRHGQTGVVDLVWRPEYSAANTGAPSDVSYPFGLARG